jgi:hypothetical protein
MAKTKAVAVISKKESSVPAYLTNKNVAGDGLESIDSSDISIPFLKLVHPLSKEAQDEGIDAGNIINSITKEIFETEDLEFLVIDMYYNWAKFEKGGGEILGRSSDGIKWRTGDEDHVGEKLTEEDQWKCKVYNFIVLLTKDMKEGAPVPYILSFKSTATANARKLKNMLIQGPKAKGVPIYSQPYQLFVSESDNGKNKWYILDVKHSDRFWVSEKELMLAKEVRATVANLRPIVRELPAETEETETPKVKNGKKKF